MPDLAAILRAAAADAVAATNQALDESIVVMEKIARVKCRVKSGRMLKSIKGRKSAIAGGTKFVGEVSAKTPYTHLVEFGTVKTQAYPFLGPAFEGGAAKFEILVERYVARILERAASAGGGADG